MRYNQGNVGLASISDRPRLLACIKPWIMQNIQGIGNNFYPTLALFCIHAQATQQRFADFAARWMRTPRPGSAPAAGSSRPEAAGAAPIVDGGNLCPEVGHLSVIVYICI